MRDAREQTLFEEPAPGVLLRYQRTLQRAFDASTHAQKAGILRGLLAGMEALAPVDGLAEMCADVLTRAEKHELLQELDVGAFARRDS